MFKLEARHFDRLERVKALAKEAKQTFTILHVNGTHSNVIGVGPSSDYTPMTLNDDATKSLS